MDEVIIAFGLKITKLEEYIINLQEVVITNQKFAEKTIELEKKIDFIMAHTEGYKYDKPNPCTTTGALYKTL